MKESLTLLYEKIDKLNDTIIDLLNEQKTFNKKLIREALDLIDEEKNND